MEHKLSSQVVWSPLSHEERTRHEILFYNQGPVDGFLPGDHARALFLRSNLPLHVLSQIWNLVDQPQDNFLDAGEFTAAMHLVQQSLRGVGLPKETLPPCLTPGAQDPPASGAKAAPRPHTHPAHDHSNPGPRREARVPTMLKRECAAYRRLFYAIDDRKRGKLKADVVRDVLLTTALSRPALARIWDVSDVDRDGQLGVDEFCIACHLTRHTKKGRVTLSGPVNVLTILPHRQSQADLVTKKAKMSELDERKKNLMALRVRKKTEASRESERAKIWRERLEILKRRHQALKDDPTDFSEVVLKEETQQLEHAETIVRQTEAVSARLDVEQKDVRRETARVIMEAEKLAQEVNKLQDEVRRLRETRRRSSQLKDLDPFHQLFEQQKEESLTGMHTPKKEFDIRIPFVHDPFDLAHLDRPPLSGEELFQSPLPDGTTPDPWSPEGVRPDMQELTLGFEDSFVDAWGREPGAGHDRNSNVLPEVLGDTADSRFSDERDELVFRTVSVTEEEDDLWNSLTITEAEGRNETLQCLHSMWNTTTDRLQQLHRDIQNTLTNAEYGRRSPESTVSEEPTPTPPLGFRDIPETFANLTAPSARVAGAGSPPDLQADPPPQASSSDCPQNPRAVTEDSRTETSDTVRLDVLAIEQSVLSDDSHPDQSQALVDEGLVPPEFHGQGALDILTVPDTNSSTISQSVPDLEHFLLPKNSPETVDRPPNTGKSVNVATGEADTVPSAASALDTSDSVSLLHEIEQAWRNSNSGENLLEVQSEHLLEDVQSGSQETDCALELQKADLATSDKDIAKSQIVEDNHTLPSVDGDLRVSGVSDHNAPPLTSHIAGGQSRIANPESHGADLTPGLETCPPQVPARRKRSVHKSPGEVNSAAQPSPSAAASFLRPPPRSRSLKKKYPAPKPPSKELDTKHLLRKQLNFDESQNADLRHNSSTLHRTSSVPVKCSNAEDVLHGEHSDPQTEGVPVIKSSSEPPKPPPRWKKKLRLSQSLHLSNPPDLRRDSVTRTQSLPEKDSVYENVTFSPRQGAITEESEKSEAAENVSVIHLNGADESVKDHSTGIVSDNPESVEGHSTGGVLVNHDDRIQKININLDDIVPNNPESAKGHFVPTADNLYVNVIDVSGGPRDRDIGQLCQESVINDKTEDIVKNESCLEVVNDNGEKLTSKAGIEPPCEEPVTTHQQAQLTQQDPRLESVDSAETPAPDSVSAEACDIAQTTYDSKQDRVVGDITSSSEAPNPHVNVIDVVHTGLNEGRTKVDQESEKSAIDIQISPSHSTQTKPVIISREGINPDVNGLSVSPEDVHVSVIEVQDQCSTYLTQNGSSDVDVDSDDEMDASARKLELENLRSQFFGKRSSDSSGENSATESSGSVTVSSTVVSIQDFSQPQEIDTDAQFVTVTKVQRVPSPERSASPSLYEIVRNKTENVNNNMESSSQKLPTKLDQKSSAKIILDLDDHQTRQELDPVLDTSTASQTSRIALDLDAHQSQHEFVPEKPKSQSKIILDLDDFSSRAELESGSSSNNNTLSSVAPDLLDSCQTSRMLLDLDDIQVAPQVTTPEESKLLIDVGGPAGNTNELPVHGSVTEPDSSGLTTPETPVSPYDGWNKLEDSDLSDGEQNFSATFTPGAPIDAPEDFAENGSVQHEASGIVLVSYQQKPPDPDFLDLTLQAVSVNRQDHAPIDNAQVSTNSSTVPGNTSHAFDPFDPFDPFAIHSEVEPSSLMTHDLKDISADAPNTDSRLLMGDGNMPEPPAGFSSTSYTDPRNSSSTDLGHNIYGDNNLNLGGHSAGEVSTSMRDNWAAEDGTQPRLIGHELGNGKILMDSATSASHDRELREQENLVNDSPGVTVSKSADLWDESEHTPGPNDDLLTERSSDSRPESAASRENLYLDLSQTPEPRSPQPEDDMDPVTGLRRTTPLSPMEKALRFVGSTELTYKVKVKGEELLSPEQAALSLELQQERDEIMGAMRVRKKRLHSWMQESIDTDRDKHKSESERKYEQRKKQQDGSEERDEIDLTNVPAPHWSAVVKPGMPEGEGHTKQEIVTTTWESDTSSPPLKKHDVNDNNNIYVSESAIEREIRQVREREEQLKRERSESTMPIHKIPDLAPVEKGSFKSVTAPSPRLPTSPPPSTPPATMYKELPEVDRDSAILKRESIIEREIREQQERERTLREEGYLRSSLQLNKEDEQSEFERQEKEHERVLAHESIVAREIRQQQEREREISSLRQSVSSVPEHEPATPTQRVTMTTAYTNDEPDVNHTTVTVTTTTVTNMEAEPVITYEEALKTKSHEGEGIIARELREQREREEELRLRYKDMGLGNFLAEQEPADTPFNRPEPAQPDLTKLSARAKSTLKPLGKMSKSVSEPVQLGASKAAKADIVVVGKVTTSVSQDTISASTKPERIAEEPTTPSDSPRDNPDGFDHSYRFTPQNETPIEREMRLVREREEELRQARGIPKASKNPDDIVEIKEISVPTHKPQVSYKRGDEGDGKFMQKLASGRLQFEIEREKRREQDLKSQGKISTLSEERVGPATRYVDVIPQEPAKQTPNWRLQTQTSTTSIQCTASPGGTSTASSTDMVDAQRDGQSHVQSHTQSHAQSNGPIASRSEPSITQRYSSQTRPDAASRERPTPTMAESRIEQELREMREREDELSGPYDNDSSEMNLRRSFTEYTAQDSSKAAAVTSQPQPANGYESHGRSDSIKTERRKSTLAEEWEKKFGAN